MGSIQAVWGTNMEMMTTTAIHTDQDTLNDPSSPVFHPPDQVCTCPPDCQAGICQLYLHVCLYLYASTRLSGGYLSIVFIFVPIFASVHQTVMCVFIICCCFFGLKSIFLLGSLRVQGQFECTVLLLKTLLNDFCQFKSDC